MIGYLGYSFVSMYRRSHTIQQESLTLNPKLNKVVYQVFHKVTLIKSNKPGERSGKQKDRWILGISLCFSSSHQHFDFNFPVTFPDN